MDIRTASADFSAPVRGGGPRTATQAVIFPRPVAQAAVDLLGYSAAFGGDDDHNFGRCQSRVEATLNDNVVTVTSTLGLRDWSGDWDGQYDGRIFFTVIGE